MGDTTNMIFSEETAHTITIEHHLGKFVQSLIIRRMSLIQLCNKTSHRINSTNYGKNNVIMLDFDDVLLPGIYLLSMDLINYNFATNSSEILSIKEEDIW